MRQKFGLRPEDKIYRCEKCGTEVSAVYFLAVGNKCPKCNNTKWKEVERC